MGSFHPFFAAPSGGQSSMTVSILFSCGHTETKNEIFDLDRSPFEITIGPCSNAECRAAASNGDTGIKAVYGEREHKIMKDMKMQLQLAGMNADGALREFSMAEPMLPQDIEATGCSKDITEALLNSDSNSRHNAAGLYLGHRGVLAMLNQLKDCPAMGATHWQAATLGNEATARNATIQRKLIALQQTTFKLTHNSYRAPGARFNMVEGIKSFEKGWGKEELAILRDSAKGREILEQPMTRANILAAKQLIRTTQQELEAFFARERAAFLADYPGAEALYASAESCSSEQRLAEASSMSSAISGFGNITIGYKPEAPASSSNSTEETDNEDEDEDDCEFILEVKSESPVTVSTTGKEFGTITIGYKNPETPASNPDIRALRPERVASRKMAKNTLTVSMEKVNEEYAHRFN